ncbi:MAG: toll/interleukin-1 receptor domain-containing protein, partial [Ginsengibacter sp.]
MATNIFISYRKDDSKWNTQLLYDRLSHYFSPRLLFKDFNTIKAGDDYRKSIDNALKKCNVLLVVIGKNWLTAKDANGVERLQNPEDLVRIEIATALNRNIRVIPVLFDSIALPAKVLLPEDLWALTLRQSVSVSETNFDYDIKHLAESIKNKHIKEGSPHPFLFSLLRYRVIIIAVSFTILSLLLTGIFGIHVLRIPYIVIAGLVSLIISLLVPALLKNKVQNKIRSRLQTISILLLTLFVISLAFHVYYFQSHTFIYKGFGRSTAYYIKGKDFTHIGDSLKMAHP